MFVGGDGPMDVGWWAWRDWSRLVFVRLDGSLVGERGRVDVY